MVEKADTAETEAERIVRLADEIAQSGNDGIREIRAITRQTHMLALNAQIEAGRAGQQGVGFSVVAKEVKDISLRIDETSQRMESELGAAASEIGGLARQVIDRLQGQRLVDLSLNAIDIVDRNLFERTCDVRWWATDAAVVEVLTSPGDGARQTVAEHRLGVILDAYTVYLDLWIADTTGRVIANGRPTRWPQAKRANVGDRAWFQNAMETQSGDDYVVDTVGPCPELGDNAALTYATAIRRNAEPNGPAIGVLGIHFDWAPQSKAVVDGVRLTEAERARSRILILDSTFRVLAASDQQGVFTETIDLQTNGRKEGYQTLHDSSVAGFAQTPGYETYAGLGWYGCIIQSR